MAQIIELFSHRELNTNFSGNPHTPEGRLIEYDPEMPIALELFTGLKKSTLLEGCWVPLSWDEKGIVVLVDDLSDMEKRAIIKTVLKTEWIIFATGIKEHIEAFISRSFSQLEIDEFLSKAVSGDEPIDVMKLVDIIITEAYTRGATDIYFESSAVSGNNRVLFWMDGGYLEYMTVTEAVAFDVVKRIKSMAKLDATDRELAKVGHMIFKNHDVPEIKIPVTTYPIDGLWEDVVLNIKNT